MKLFCLKRSDQTGKQQKEELSLLCSQKSVVWILNPQKLPVAQKVPQQLEAESNSVIYIYIYMYINPALSLYQASTVDHCQKGDGIQAIHIHSTQLLSSFSSYQNANPNSFQSQESHCHCCLLVKFFQIYQDY